MRNFLMIATLLLIFMIFPPNALGNFNVVSSKNVGDGYTYFLLKKKVGKENFVSVLR